MPRSWLVTGARGQLGRDLVHLLEQRPGDEVLGLGRAELDLTDEQQVRTTVRGWLDRAQEQGRQAVCLNAGAYTAVDAAETDELTARRVNGDAPGWLAEELAGRGRLVHVSTDYVFDGTATRPYPVDAPVAPRTAYGRTKALGEQAIAGVRTDSGADAVVVRTAWVWSPHGANFVTTMLRLAGERDAVSVVDDQVGAPTLSADLAAGLIAVGQLPAPVPPVLHLTNAGEVSWYGFARAVFGEAGLDPDRVGPTSTAEFARPAPRPAYSVLDLSAWVAAGLPAPRAWADALREGLRSA